MDSILTTEQIKQLTQAQQLLQEKNWSKASAILEGLYQDVSDIEISHLLVESLYMDRQYKLAQQYADEHRSSYLATQELYKLMIELLLSNHQFIIARQFALLSGQTQWQKTALTEIEQQELKDLSELGATIKTNTRQFYHLGDENFIEQKRRFEAAYQLPLAQYVMGAKFLLRDPFTNPLIRSSILQALQRLNFKETVKLYWLDGQEHEINCQTLQPVDKNTQVMAVLAQFETELGQKDPITLQILTQEFQLQMAFCYPLIDQVVTNANIWVEVAIKRTTQANLQADPSTSKIIKWQDKLALLSQELLQNTVN